MKYRLTDQTVSSSCPGEEFTPPPNNEDLEIVQGKVDIRQESV
jgi:hypothetical protein